MSRQNIQYIHNAPVRVWHWINAVGFLLLIATGMQIRFAEMISFFSLQDAIKLHNYVGFAVIIDYTLWISYYFGTGKIRLYFQNYDNFFHNAYIQVKYYAFGFFRGEPAPHVATPDNKFNPLQQNVYVAIMLICLPSQMITGLFLWRIKRFEDFIALLGGIKIVDTIHVLLFYLFIAFICVHSYLATCGHSPTAHIKAMFTGYEEHPDH